MKLRTIVLGAIAGLFLTSCGGSSPEKTTEDFINSLAKGECDKALALSTGNAEESVNALKDSGCEPTEEELYGNVICEVEGDKTICYAMIKNSDNVRTAYRYDLEKVDGSWKIGNYNKDMMSGMMDDMGGESGPAEFENETESEYETETVTEEEPVNEAETVEAETEGGIK